MKYYVLETTMVQGAYKNAGFKEALAGHMAFVKAQFAQGIILFSGTKLDNSGGVRVLKITDDEASLFNTLVSVIPFVLSFFISKIFVSKELIKLSFCDFESIASFINLSSRLLNLISS